MFKGAQYWYDADFKHVVDIYSGVFFDFHCIAHLFVQDVSNGCRCICELWELVHWCGNTGISDSEHPQRATDSKSEHTKSTCCTRGNSRWTWNAGGLHWRCSLGTSQPWRIQSFWRANRGSAWTHVCTWAWEPCGIPCNGITKVCSDNSRSERWSGAWWTKYGCWNGASGRRRRVWGWAYRRSRGAICCTNRWSFSGAGYPEGWVEWGPETQILDGSEPAAEWMYAVAWCGESKCTSSTRRSKKFVYQPLHLDETDVTAAVSQCANDCWKISTVFQSTPRDVSHVNSDGRMRCDEKNGEWWRLPNTIMPPSFYKVCKAKVSRCADAVQRVSKGAEAHLWQGGVRRFVSTTHELHGPCARMTHSDHFSAFTKRETQLVQTWTWWIIHVPLRPWGSEKTSAVVVCFAIFVIELQRFPEPEGQRSHGHDSPLGHFCHPRRISPTHGVIDQVPLSSHHPKTEFQTYRIQQGMGCKNLCGTDVEPFLCWWSYMFLAATSSSTD